MRIQDALGIGLVAAIALWSTVIGAGFFSALEYETTPGDADVAPPKWPADSSVVPRPNQANLVLAIHPRCPCTRATIDELVEIMAEEPARIVAHVLVYRPAGCEKGWERSDLWHRVAAIRGASIHTDDNGLEARRFGLLSSGHALLYDNGRLRFGGGLTNARGHAGNSVGHKSIVAILNHLVPEKTTTPVYGCSLVGAGTPGIERCSPCRE